jgi:hypothetical protein
MRVSQKNIFWDIIDFGLIFFLISESDQSTCNHSNEIHSILDSVYL